jgi:hypothetical protein
MEDLIKIICGVLGTIIVAGGAVIIAYFKMLQRRFENKQEKVQAKHEVAIKELSNG